MKAVHAAKDEPIPGYRLLEPLGKGGFGEVWKCEAPGGLIKAIKFVHGSDDDVFGQDGYGAEQELRALQHIKGIRHPFLLSIERVEIVDGDLIIVMELADRSLHDLLEKSQQEGRPGLPRDELLGYLAEVAEVLDLLNHGYGLQHRDIKPRNLFLVGRHIKVADFGLVNSLAELYGSQGKAVNGAITPLYAAPEVFLGQLTLYSDQYSLAATYHELLTGELPIRATGRQRALLLATTDPDLSLLSEEDRPILARALARESSERFPTCIAFIEALKAASRPTAVVLTGANSWTTAFEFAQVAQQHALPAEPPALSPSPSLPSAVADTPAKYRRESRMISTSRRGDPGEGGLPGYQLLGCLGRGPAGEVWRARGPMGDARMVRFVTRPDPARFEEDPFQRLLSIRHSALPALEVVPADKERVAIISEAGDSSLLLRCKECQAANQPGIPRAELLGYLSQAALALDQLYHEHQLQHLSLTPRHLAIAAGHVLLLDFGLAEILWLPTGLQPATQSPLYAARELFDGLISDACDQYSLALVFQEMLIGVHPLRTANNRQSTARNRGEPDVSQLSKLDQAIVRQALHAEPEKRFRSCQEFILALAEAQGAVGQAAVSVAVRESSRTAAASSPLAP
jgi:serine/threonine protein kinase